MPRERASAVTLVLMMSRRIDLIRSGKEMFRRTLCVGKSVFDWNTIPTSRFATSTSVTSSSSKKTAPVLILSSPATALINEVFPAPDGPTSTTSSP